MVRPDKNLTCILGEKRRGSWPVSLLNPAGVRRVLVTARFNHQRAEDDTGP